MHQGLRRWSRLVGWCVSLVVAGGCASTEQVIRTRRLEVVDGNDQPRLVLAAPLGNPVIHGKEFPRSTNVFGLQLLDPDGNELGGIGMTEDGSATMLCFDHETAESICLIRHDSFVGVSVLDWPADSAPVGKTGAQRFQLGIWPDGQSKLIMSDRSGTGRAELTLSEDQDLRFRILGNDGEELFAIPEKKND